MFGVTFKRLLNSTVIWSWITNGLRAGSGLILLPLLFRKLSKSDLGMSAVFLSLSALGAVIDFGFAPTIDRFISYAMGGAMTLEAHGVPERGGSHSPNYTLLWDLLRATRRLYRYLSLILLVVMGVGGTIVVENLIRTEHGIHPEFSILAPRLAWGITLVSVLLDIYSNWWNIFLRGLNEVRAAAQVASVAAFAKLVTASALLLCGGGLLSLPIGTILSSYIQRRYARQRCLQLLPPPLIGVANFKSCFTAMWPNSWRMGMQLASSFLIAQTNTLLCAHFYHLEMTGVYTYSVQLMNYAVMMASVWTATKWPLIGQYQTHRDFAMIQRVLRPRIWLQTFTFLTLAGGVVFVAPGFLHWVGKGKELLPTGWLLVIMFSTFMELQLSTCGLVISTGNRLPFVWPAIVTNVFSMALSLALLRWSNLGVGSFILGPIVGGVFFNYWYWPPFAARSLQTTLFALLFRGANETTQPRQSEIPIA